MTAPTYIGTDRPVMLGDRGACTVANGQPGVLVSVWFDQQDPDRRRRGTIRWPNQTIENVYLDELHWVDPATTVDVELTDDLYQRLCKHAVSQLSEAELQAVATAVARGIEQR